jgi:hypothetical protein
MAGPLDWLQQMLGGYDKIPPGGTDLDSLGYLDQVLQGRLPYQFDRPYGQGGYQPPQEPPSYALPGGGTRLTADPPQEPPPKPFRYPDPVTTPFPAYDTWTPSNQGGSAIDNLLTKLGDIGWAGAGIAERFNLAGANLLNPLVWTGEEKPQGGQILVAPGLAAAGDAATFLTGGLVSPLSAAGTISQGMRFARTAPKDAVTTLLDKLPAYDPNTLTIGGMAGMTRGLTPAQLAQRRRMEQRRMMGYGLEPEPLPPLETPPPAIGSNTAQFSVPPVPGTQLPPVGQMDPALVAMGRLAAPGSRALNPLPVPEDAEGGVRRMVNRTDPNIGAVKNPGPGLLPAVGEYGPMQSFYLGPVNAQQWAQRVETILGNDIEAAGRWYADALPAYERAFGKELGSKMLGAWLIANQNVDPGGAQLNATRALEQYRAHTQGKPETKRPGLAEDALFRYWDAVLSGDPSRAGGGSGQKIYDFIDSAAGKTTRTFYGDDPRAGQPAVADVHTLRDSGKIDPTLHEWIRTHYGDEVANRFAVDSGTTPGEAQYEWSAGQVRQWAQDLNAMNWRGRSDWTPAEIQAIGWKAMSQMMGRAGQTAEDAIRNTERFLSYELDFGAGAPWHKTFPEWQNLTQEEKAGISAPIINKIMDKALEITGATEGWRHAGTGAWRQDLNPAFRSQLLSSPEAAMDVANIIGYLGQQTAVYMTRFRPGGQNWAVTIYGKGLDDPATLKALWKDVYTAHPDLAGGFSPIVDANGTPGIHIGFDRAKGIRGVISQENAHKALGDRIAAELTPTIDAASKKLGIDTRIRMLQADALEPTNDWSKYPDGRDHLRRLSARYGSDIRQRLDSYASGELEPSIRREIEEALRRRQEAISGGSGSRNTGKTAIGLGLLGGGLLGSSGAGAATYQPPPRYNPLDDLARRIGP